MLKGHFFLNLKDVFFQTFEIDFKIIELFKTLSITSSLENYEKNKEYIALKSKHNFNFSMKKTNEIK